jgi:integrase
MTNQTKLRRGGRRRANGEGNVTQRKDGLWMARVSLPDRTRATSYSRTYAAAQEKVRAMLARIEAGAPAQETEQQMSAFMKRWLETKRMRAPKTYEEYHRQNRLYIDPALGALKLRQVTPHAVERLIATLAHDRPATAQHVLTTLRNAFSLAVDWRLISSNPAARVEKPKHRPKPVAPMSFEEAQAVLFAFVGHQLEAFITFMLDTGTRPSEALALRWENVDFARGLVRIVASLPMGGARVAIATKTARSNRTITLMYPTLALLKRHQAEQRDAGMVPPGCSTGATERLPTSV